MTDTIENFIKECQAADWASKRVLEDEFPRLINTLKALYRELEEELQPDEIPLTGLYFGKVKNQDLNRKKISAVEYIDNILNQSTTVSGTYEIIIQLAISLEEAAKELKKELTGKYILTST
jgi:hypothetical protein